MDNACLKEKKIVYIHDVEIEVDTRAQKEIAALERAKAQVIVCAWNKNKDGPIEGKKACLRGINTNIINICVKVAKTKGLKENLVPLIRYQLKLSLWLIKNRKKFDYIHAVNMDTAFTASIIGKIQKKRIIYDIFDDYADSHAREGTAMHSIIRWFDRKIIRRADAVIICSEKRREQLACQPNKLEIIHNSPDIFEYRDEKNKFSVDNRLLNVVYVGNLYPGRMTLELANIIANSENMALYCGGAGEYEKELSDMANLYENIHFYGRMSYEDVLALEDKCDVIPAIYNPDFSNHRFAAPNKFYEALFLGKPTIMVRGTGMDSEVEKLQTGLVIDYSQESLTNALGSIKDSIVYWRNKKEDIRNCYHKYSWKVMEKRLLQLYEEI